MTTQTTPETPTNALEIAPQGDHWQVIPPPRPVTLAPEPADRETCTTCYHHKNDHMKTPDIIIRLNAAACMLNDYEQHNDFPEEVFGDRTAADACDDAAALIERLTTAIQFAIGDLDELFEHDPEMNDQLIGTYCTLETAIAAIGRKA